MPTRNILAPWRINPFATLSTAVLLGADTNIFSSVVVFVDCVASVVTAGDVVFAVVTGFAILAPELYVATYVLVPVTGAKKAYCIPFIVCVVNDTELPLRVIEIKVPLCELNGNIALMFVALLRAVTSNVSWLLLHDMIECKAR